MKKNIALTHISIFILSILGQTIFASADNNTALDCMLKNETIPEIINYEDAVSLGHIQRAYGITCFPNPL